MKKKISIIIPFYNESANIPLILSRVRTLISKEKNYNFEILLMDNSSNDGSDKIAKEEIKNFEDAKYFKMSRNFGYQANIKAGYDNCTGDAAVQLDADGEDEPELISEFIKNWENNFDVVYGIREKFKIPIIEDCAHAFGAEYRGKKLGYYSDFAIYSFQAIKHLTTIDGGLLVLRSSTDYDRAKKLRWFGLDKAKPRLQNDITEGGFKYHMNDVNATFGLVQLNHLEENVNKYIENGLFFDKELKNLEGIEVIQYHDDTKPSYWLYTAIIDRRDSFIEYMKSHGVICSTLHLRNDRHSIFEDGSHLPGLEGFYSRFIHWGCGWWLSQEDKIKIVDLIKKGW